ncbi:hypothetical protein [Sphingomonas sp. Mn802worker]|uniref:hypothetical protein n=1 Tax=Sphingomonas sp. Mn802worker TaxID=629773 RepID=UPI0003662F8C|nr:hypothetical protein [Sphingomonas sp. Mn802worker]
MFVLVAITLLAGVAGPPHVYHERFDHAGAAVDVTYRGTVISHMQQVGAASAPGRPATLHCRWTARVMVERQAEHAGQRSTRQIEAPALANGMRPGWCAGQATAIRAQVAAARERMRVHLVKVAAHGRSILIAELQQRQG